jgi:hypothetical protein
VRVLFTVALAVAMLAVVLPALDAVSVDRAESQTRAAVADLVEAARALAADNDALYDRAVAARATVTLDFPTGGVASTPLASLDVGPPGTDTARSVGSGPAATRITWRVAGGRRHTRQVDGLRLQPAADGRLRVDPGRTRIVLRLLARNGTRLVTVSEHNVA